MISKRSEATEEVRFGSLPLFGFFAVMPLAIPVVLYGNFSERVRYNARQAAICLACIAVALAVNALVQAL